MIVAEHLVKDYGAIRAVRDVSFTVKPGEILGFLGPNGAGKSTTMKMITGFLSPTSGTASIGGHDIRENPVPAKRLLGYLPENGPLYPEMTVLEFLGFAADMRGLRGKLREEALDRVTEICHLRGVRNQTIETLSKGFRQRVGLAQAILHDPPCLVLDEPTDGLDPNQKREVRHLIGRMAKDKAIILSTHILEEVEAMCNRVIIIAGGEVIVDENPEALARRHLHFRCQEVRLEQPDHPAAADRIRKLDAVRRVEMRPGHLLVYPKDGVILENELWQLAVSEGWRVDTIQPAPVRLEEVFYELTKAQIS